MSVTITQLVADLAVNVDKAIKGQGDPVQSRLGAYLIGKIIYGMNSQSRYFSAKLHHGQTIPFFEPPKPARMRKSPKA